MYKIKKLFKKFKLYLNLKHNKANKYTRMLNYAIYGYITFEQYEKYLDNYIKKGGENK